MREKLAGALSLPRELMLNLPQITLTGASEALIENYKNIIEYSETFIRVHTNSGVLALTGSRLVLKQLTAENIIVCGKISKLEFLE